MLKTIGILLIFIPIASVGVYISNNIKNKSEFWNQMILFNKMIEAEILYKSSDIFTFINSLDIETRYKRLKFLKNFNYIKNEYIDTNISKHLKIDEINDKERELLTEYFVNIGKSDVENQIKHLKLFDSVFKSKKEQYDKQYIEKSKVYRSVSVFIGAGVSIMLI